MAMTPGVRRADIGKEGMCDCRSVAGTTFLGTPWILPIRGYLEDVKRLMVSDVYVGKVCRQRGLKPSKF